MLNITKTGCWQCQQQITLNKIEEGGEGGVNIVLKTVLLRQHASGPCARSVAGKTRNKRLATEPL